MGGNAFGGQGFGQTASLPAPVLSGVAVTPETALTFTACYACINVRATDLAALPLEVKRKRKEGGRVPVPDDPRYDLVFCEPNSNTTSMMFRQAMGAHRLGWGNAYAEIIRSRGMPVELHLHSPRPTETWPEFSKNKTLWYQADGGRRQIRGEDMIHFALLGWNGISGYSPIALHRQAVGYGIAIEQFGAAFYGNAMTPRGALKVPGRLKPEQLKNLRESYAAIHSDTVNAHRLLILEEGSEFQPFAIDPKDAEYILARQFQAIEMCRIFRVPPPRIQDYTGVTGVYKAFDDLIQDYISSTLGPDAELCEQEWNRKLFTRRERAHGLHLAHDFTALLRGNMQARADYFTKRFGVGSITPDEIREREGDNPYPNQDGRRAFVSTSFVPIDKAGETKATLSLPKPDPPENDPKEAETKADEKNEESP
jgi:HK97 family phage portal protein